LLILSIEESNPSSIKEYSMAITTVIVGAGSGGAALASRLTEDPDQHVILVEAGPDYEELALVPEDVRDAREMSVEKHDWGLKAYFLEPTTAREAMPYARGRIVGGSSSVNAAIAERATKEDLDTWVAAGNPEWSYEKTLPFFVRLENDLDFPNDPGHGSSGPVPIMRHFEEEWPAITRAFAQACEDRGFAKVEDFNAKSSSGYGAVPRNLIGEEELRGSALLTYLAQARNRPNLKIRANTLARRVLFNGTTAVGVEVEQDDRIESISADRVVLAGGAFHTPHLMMLSGVGPRKVLEQHGIEPVIINEAVGKNLQDHPFSPMVALLKEKTDKSGVRAQVKYSTGTENLIDDMMIFAAVLDPATMNIPAETKGLKALMMNNLLAKPHSAGWVTLSSPDPKVQPEIHVNFLSHPLDIERLKGSMRKSWDMITSSPMADEIQEICFLDAETIADDAKLEAYIRAYASTSLHAAGTCRMGPAGDPEAVVDQYLGVHGAENLWIADASVMVNVTTGLTNLTAYMIGERLAEWLRNGTDSATDSAELVFQAP
jgi:choline dehydrogenase